MPYSNQNNGSTENQKLQVIDHNSQPNDEEKLRTIAHVVYGCYALFWLAGVSLLIGVIIAYIKRKDAYGSIYATHFEWQIVTFWVSLLVFIPSFILKIILIGYIFLFVLTIWLIYRIIRGWLALYENRPLN